MSLTGWDATKKFSITIAAADVSADEVDFPVLVNIGATSGKTALDTTAVFTELGASSLKIAVEDGDTGNQCYAEVENWDSVGLSAQLWIKIPAVSSTVDTIINLYYDSTQADNTTYVGGTTTVPAQNVWDTNFAAVYHMAQDPSGTAPQILDSTANANHGTAVGTWASTDLVTGLIGKALSFSGANEIDLGVLQNSVTAWTVESFFKTADTDGPFLQSRGTGAGLSLTLYNDAGKLEFVVDSNSIIIGNTGGTIINDSVWHQGCGTFYAASGSAVVSGDYALFVDGIKETVLTAHSSGAVTSPVDSAETTIIGHHIAWGTYLTAIISEHRISSVIRSDNWDALTNLSNRDQLGTWVSLAPAGTSLRLPIDQVFGISSDLRPVWLQSFALLMRQIIDQVFGISADLRPVWLQSFALKMRQIIEQNLDDAPTIRQTILQLFGDAGQVRRAWLQTFGDAAPLRRSLDQNFAISADLRRSINQHFAITSAGLRQVLEQSWSIEDFDVLRQVIYQVFSISGQPGQNLQYIVSTTLAGAAIPNPATINIERDIDLYYIDAALMIAGQDHWVRYEYGADLTITINGHQYVLVVVTPKRDRKHGGGSYMVDARSPACRLGPGFADTVTGELTGMASAIAASLAPGFSISWEIHDEYYGPGKFIAAGEYPIDLIRKMASASKAVVQSSPDGSLRVIYRRQVHVDQRAAAPVDYTLSDANDFFTAGETPVRRPGYNKYTVSNQNASNASLRMESTDISVTEKEIRGYQVPWTGEFGLIHTGGSWVSITPKPIEERSVTETIEIVTGKGRVAYPIYDYSSLVWQQVNLGTITISEDGTIESETAADSLLEITYKTRCRLWIVHDSRIEDLQLVSETDK